MVLVIYLVSGVVRNVIGFWMVDWKKKCNYYFVYFVINF